MARITEIVKRSGTSFYWAMRVLPPFKRNAMFAVYAFCREVDDIADGPERPTRKIQELDIWQGEIDRLYDGNPTHLVTQALATPVQTFGFARADFDAVIAGMQMDAVDRLRIADSSELELYCDRVACAVGRLSCAVFGIPSELAQPLAKNLGEALQLTNILRDIHEDALRDHVYLPADLLRRHDCDPTDAVKLVDQPGLAAVCREIAAIAEARFAAAETIISGCDRNAVRPALVMKAVYRDILNGLQRRGWDHISTPLKRSKLRRYALVARSLIFG